MRIHTENINADDADVLSGTALNQLESGGQLDIFVTSNQADTLMSISGPDNEPIAENIEIPQGQTGVRIDVTKDVPFQLPILQGGHFTVDINVVTAATVQFLAIYRKAGVDF